jgi:PAS domain S-box-containing protein
MDRHPDTGFATAEEALPARDHLYRDLFEVTRDGILQIDHAGRVAGLNERLAEMVGSSVAEMLGQSWLNWFAPDQRAGAQERLEIMLRGDFSRYQFERTLRHRDGSDVWVLGSAGPWHSPDGRFLGVHAVLTDITDRKRAEEALRQSEERYRRMVDGTDEGIMQVGPHGNIITLNPAMARMVGETVNALVGRSILDLIDPEEHDLMRQRMVTRMAGDAATRHYPLHLRHRDGRDVWVQVTGNMLRDDMGRPMGALALVTDVTAQRQAEKALRESEERYRRMVETAQEGIAQIDTRDRLAYANQRLADLLGYRLEELVGLPFSAVVAEQDWPYVLRTIEQRRAGDAGQDEARYRRQDGTVIWVSVASSPLFEAEGRYRGTLALVTDITVRKRSERALAVTNAARSALLYAGDERELPRRVCAEIVSVGGYVLAWIGYLSPERDQVVHPMAAAGAVTGYLDEIVVTRDDTPTGQGPMGRAIHTGLPQVVGDVRTDPSYAPWRGAALGHRLVAELRARRRWGDHRGVGHLRAGAGRFRRGRAGDLEPDGRGPVLRDQQASCRGSAQTGGGGPARERGALSHPV